MLGSAGDTGVEGDNMSELVDKLREEQPIEASLRPRSTTESLRVAIEKGVLYIKFTRTNGGTDLCMNVDRDASSLASADFDGGSGRVEIVGDLSLDFIPVRFRGILDLETLQGTGALYPRESIQQTSSGTVPPLE